LTSLLYFDIIPAGGLADLPLVLTAGLPDLAAVGSPFKFAELLDHLSKEDKDGQEFF